MESGKHKNVLTDLICGLWYADALGRMDLTLKRKQPVPTPDGGFQESAYGHWFDFKENGEFVDYYSAPCGNDGRLHHWVGSWQLRNEGQTIFLQIEDYRANGISGKLRPTEGYKEGLELQIVEITEQEMRLKFKEIEDTRAAAWLWE